MRERLGNKIGTEYEKIKNKKKMQMKFIKRKNENKIEIYVILYFLLNKNEKRIEMRK